jgi:hypothetical protein
MSLLAACWGLIAGKLAWGITVAGLHPDPHWQSAVGPSSCKVWEAISIFRLAKSVAVKDIICEGFLLNIKFPAWLF